MEPPFYGSILVDGADAIAMGRNEMSHGKTNLYA